jgi:hypothetical protein
MYLPLIMATIRAYIFFHYVIGQLLLSACNGAYSYTTPVVRIFWISIFEANDLLSVDISVVCA